MKKMFNRTKIGDNIYFSTIVDSRYKLNSVKISFLTNLDEKTASLNSVIPKLLSKSSQDYPTLTLLNNRLSSLYAANVSDFTGKFGDVQYTGIAVSAIDNAFALEGEDIIGEAVDILLGCLFKPVTEGNGFSARSFELEKKSLVDDIEAQINDKMVYASNKGIEIGVKGESAAILATGSVESARAITNEQAFNQYKKMLKAYPIEIVCAGCNSFEGIREKLEKAFGALERSADDIPQSVISKLKDEVENVTERMAVTQSKMSMVFKTDFTDYEALSVMCDIFGGNTSSKLFMNVREKMSLCYYCWAKMNRAKGLMTINCGIEDENIEKARAEILNQFELMKKGEFTDEDIANSKLSLQNKFNSVPDSLSGISGWYFSEILRGTQRSPEDAVRETNAVTRERIVAAANSVKLDSVYVLTSE